MASYTKRGSVWRVQICTAHGRKSKTFKTKAQAQAWARDFDATATNKPTFKTIAHAYLVNVAENKKDFKNDYLRVNRILQYSFADKSINDINAKDIAIFRADLLKTVSNATANRYLSAVSSIFNYAIKDLFITNHNPCRLLRKLNEPKPRERRLQDFEKTAILNALGYSQQCAPKLKKQQLAVMFLLALETGARLGELCKLEWRNVNYNKRFFMLEDTKNGDNRAVPMSSRAVFLLEQMQDINSVKVFDFQSLAASALFKKYAKKAGVLNFHFHDTRHEAITQLARKIDVLDLARMIGHRDPRSLMIYYNATATEIAARLE